MSTKKPSSKKWDGLRQMMDRRMMFDCAGSGTIQTHGHRAARILSGATQGTLFTYLWRRFGPPALGWDDYKEVVGYWFSTRVPGVGFGMSCWPGNDLPNVFSGGAKRKHWLGISYALDHRWAQRVRRWESAPWDAFLRRVARHFLVNPRAGDEMRSLGELTRHALRHWEHEKHLYQPLACLRYFKRMWAGFVAKEGPVPRARDLFRKVQEYQGDWRDDEPVPAAALPPSPTRQIIEAIEEGFRDLLRPVSVRDMWINACGVLSDDQVGRPGFHPAEISPVAGFGCAPELMAARENWCDLVEVVGRMGVKAALSKLGLKNGDERTATERQLCLNEIKRKRENLRKPGEPRR